MATAALLLGAPGGAALMKLGPETALAAAAALATAAILGYSYAEED